MLTVLILVLGYTVGTWSDMMAYGVKLVGPIDFDKCANNPDHHCYSYSPQLNTGPTLNPNWSFDSFLPDGTCNITGTMDNQGNCSTGPMVVTDSDWTFVKQNPTIFSNQNIHTVSINPNITYCPFGIYTITHQDGYLYKIYNKTTGLDLTDYAYPSFCYSVTGPNPINGKGGIIPSPNTLAVSTDKHAYASGDKIIISGTAPSQAPDISLIVRNPIGNLVTISQVTPISGIYGYSFTTGGSLWQTPGTYTVTVQQGTLTAKTTFDLAVTVPEFGEMTFPAMIIAFTALMFLAFYCTTKLVRRQ